MFSICDKHLCTGCGSCFNLCNHHAVTMVENEQGFYYPEVDESLCVNCGLCINSCPCNDNLDNRDYKSVYAAFVKKDTDRMKSSSGGIFFCLAQEVICKNGSVFGAVLDDSFAVKHIEACTLESLEQMRNSKYVQSDIGLCYQLVKKRLHEGKTVLFSGTPCQIAGLRSFLGKENPNLLTVDVVCHGVPSPGIFKRYIQSEEEIAGAKLQSMIFRSKRIGWKKFYTERKFSDGKEADWADTFVPGFLQNLYLRESCYSCQYASEHRQGDITLGDYWKYQETAPEYIEDDDKGISLVIINSEKGNAAFQKIKKKIIFVRRTMEDAKRGNPSLYVPCSKPEKYDDFWRDANAIPWGELKKKYIVEQNTDEWMSGKLRNYYTIPFVKRHWLHKIKRIAGRLYHSVKRVIS